MAGIDLATAEARLTSYLAAETAILSGAQEYSIDMGVSRRTVKRGDLAEIREGIKYWNDWCQKLGSTREGITAIGVIPV